MLFSEGGIGNPGKEDEGMTADKTKASESYETVKT